MNSLKYDSGEVFLNSPLIVKTNFSALIVRFLSTRSIDLYFGKLQHDQRFFGKEAGLPMNNKKNDFIEKYTWFESQIVDHKVKLNTNN